MSDRIFGWSLPPGVTNNDIDPAIEELEEGRLRLWHVPQIPGKAFYVEVKNVDEAKKLLVTLAEYDLFQFKNKIKPDYANASGLEVVREGEWYEWCSNDEDPVYHSDIWDLIRSEKYSTEEAG
jgi:hypothetical protein